MSMKPTKWGNSRTGKKNLVKGLLSHIREATKNITISSKMIEKEGAKLQGSAVFQLQCFQYN